MILRLFRCSLQPGREAAVTDAIHDLVSQGLPAVPGLLRGTFARSMDDGSETIVVVTLWQDIESLRAVIGDDWDRPHFFPGFHDLLAGDAEVQHFEVAAEYVPDVGVTTPGEPG